MFDAIRQPVRAALRLGSSTTSPLKTLLSNNASRSFTRDEKGSVALIFALTAFVVVSLVGGAVDFGRAYSMQTRLQNALDSASLAASVAYQNDPNHDSAAALQQADRYFSAAMTGISGVNMTRTLDTTSKTVTMAAQITVSTPFLAMAPIANIQSITLNAATETTSTEGVAGGGGNSEVELALMLDTTGSMGWDSGNGTSKISALMTSATSFVNILLPDGTTPQAKIALVPFAPNVKVDDTTATLITGQPLTKQVTDSNACGETCVNTTCARFRNNGTCRTWNQSCSANTCTVYLSRCMIDRTGISATTEQTPGSGTYMTPTWASSLSNATSCTPAQAYVPLTTNKATLTATISSFSANGATAGALGTAWAWYALSPTFNSITATPTGIGSAKPKAYGAANLKKIAVLMTDGEYNCGAAASGSCSDTNTTTISQRAVDLCTGMKNQNIEVYTIGFKLDVQIAKDTLRNCATDANHAFLAEDAATLEQIFRTIAYRAVPIHIRK